MQIPGLTGGVTDSKHQGTFEIDSFQWGVADTTNSSSGTGAGAGKVTFNPITITKKLDKGSVSLFLLAAQGTIIKELDLTVLTSESGAVSETLMFKEVVVVSYMQRDDAGGPIQEVLSLEFGAISLSTPTGANGSNETGGWDLGSNESS